MKRCSRCHTDRPLEDFAFDNRATGRRSSWCKECLKTYRRERYAADPSVKARQLAATEASRAKRYGADPKKAWHDQTWASAKWRCSHSLPRRQSAVGLPCEIHQVDCPDVCPVLGLPLEYKRNPRGTRLDTSPSLDRIDPAKGYVPGNVRVISCRANQLKNNATVEELRRVLADLERLPLPSRA